MLLLTDVSLSLVGCEQLEGRAYTAHVTLNTLNGWMKADIY